MAGKDVYDDDREAIGWVKRVLEYITMIPGFEEELKKDPKGTLDKYGFPLTPEDVALSHTDPDDPMRLVAVYPESKGKLYADFVNRKIRTVAKTRNDCTPSEPKFQKWRQRQMDRCLLDLGPQNMMIIHTPLTFELANGCSVGCEFCGLNAGPLRGLFRYTDENAALWKDILARAKELFGSAAGEGTLYFGTEPLDNPDYEHFKDDYFKEFDNLPQITTAVSTRNIERLKPLIKELNEDGRFIYRFSILSQDMFKQVCEAFTPEELALVELLPQYDEAPGNHFADVGRNEGRTGKEAISGTISCVSGFLINMCTRTVTLTTPTWADDEHPEGMIILAKEEFTDAEDLFDKIGRMIKENMKVTLEPDDIIYAPPYLNVVQKEDDLYVESDRGSALVIREKNGEALVKKVFELAKQGCYTRREIVTEIINDTKVPAIQSQYLFFMINRLWKKGILSVKEG